MPSWRQASRPATADWPYLDVDAGQLRGVLVARITTNVGVVYVLEIQRRHRGDATAGTSGPSKENFQGLVALPGKDESIEKWLPEFLDRIRRAKGVVKHVLGVCPRKSASFNHISLKRDKVLLEAAVVNAFRKVGVDLPGRR